MPLSCRQLVIKDTDKIIEGTDKNFRNDRFSLKLSDSTLSCRRPASQIFYTLALAGGLVSGVAAETTTAPLVVTGTRTAQTLDQSLAPVSVLTRADIQASSATSLPELLRQLPGLDFSLQGGRGKLSSLFMRGTNSDQVLVLVDGVRLGSVTAGTTAFEHLPLNQIERIEVVRGPRGALYGSEALGGVVQIFTRRGEPGVRVAAGYGSHDHRQLDTGIQGEAAAIRYHLNLGYEATRGFDAQSAAATDDDRDGYRNRSLSAGLSRDWGALNLELGLLRAQGDVEFDGFFDRSDFVQQALSARLEWQTSLDWTQSLTLGQSRDELESRGASAASEFDSEQLQLNWQHDFYLSDTQLLSLGLDYRDDLVDSTSDFDPDSRYNRALFAQWQGESGRHSWLLGVRHDDNEAFGGETTGHLEWGLDLSDGLRLNAGAGTAFKAPSFNELFFPGFGNLDLAPETAHSLELGLAGKPPGGALSWSLRLYQTRIDDLIETVDTGGFVFAPRNVSEARIQGLEAEVAYRLAGWQTRANFSVLDPRNEDTGKRLRRRSPRTLFVSLGRNFQLATSRLNLGLEWLLQDGRYEDAANTQRLGGYGTLGLKAGWQPAPAWQWQLKVDNALDRDYETAAGFNNGGRTLMLTLAWQPSAS